MDTDVLVRRLQGAVGVEDAAIEARSPWKREGFAAIGEPGEDCHARERTRYAAKRA
jgi:hypothetical protein